MKKRIFLLSFSAMLLVLCVAGLSYYYSNLYLLTASCLGIGVASYLFIRYLFKTDEGDSLLSVRSRLHRINIWIVVCAFFLAGSLLMVLANRTGIWKVDTDGIGYSIFSSACCIVALWDTRRRLLRKKE